MNTTDSPKRILSERIREALYVKEKISYRAVPHVCRKCGGRIGQAVSGQGPSPGGLINSSALINTNS